MTANKMLEYFLNECPEGFAWFYDAKDKTTKIARIVDIKTNKEYKITIEEV